MGDYALTYLSAWCIFAAAVFIMRFLMARFFISSQLSSALLLSTLLSIGVIQANAAVPVVQGSLSGNTVSNTGSSSINNDTQTADTQGSTLWKLYQQVQQLQQEIRELRGQLEAQQNGLDRTQKDLKNRYTDLDQRLESLREKSEDSSTDDTVADDTNTDSHTTDTTTDKDAVPTNAAPIKNSKATPINIPRESKPPSNPLSSPAPNPSANAGNVFVQQSADADKQAYIGAYDAYKVGGATKAIKPMQQFIVNFPNSVYVPNAYYWLGEFHLASNPADFTKAKKSFNEVVNKYPKSAKASTALYRIATITQEIDKRPQEALSLMQKLNKDYPTSAEAQYAKSFISTYAKKP